MENQQKAENMHANSESWVNEDSQLSLQVQLSNMNLKV